MTSRSRVGARKLIAETISSALEEDPSLRGDLAALFEIVAKAYPFNTRKRSALKLWTDEVQRARAQFAPSGRLASRCAACGARPGMPCRPLDETDALLSERELATQTAPRRRARVLAEQIVHAGRRAPTSEAA